MIVGQMFRKKWKNTKQQLDKVKFSGVSKMKSFKDYYGNKLENARKILEEVSEDIWKRYPNNDFINELDTMVRQLDELKDNMSCYPI